MPSSFRLARFSGFTAIFLLSLFSATGMSNSTPQQETRR